MPAQDLENMFVKGLDLFIDKLNKLHPEKGIEAAALSVRLATQLLEENVSIYVVMLALASLLRNALTIILTPQDKLSVHRNDDGIYVQARKEN